MKVILITRALLTGCAMVFVASVGCAETKKVMPRLDSPVARIGIYDSRAIAVAFVGSEVFNKYMADLKSQHDMAKVTGDTKIMATLEAEAAARQEMLHKQAFSTAPVDSILKYIAGQLPAIKKQAGVGIILSKWDKQALPKYKSLGQVDVTMLLVEAFRPNGRQKKIAVEIQNREPVPLAKMEDLKH